MNKKTFTIGVLSITAAILLAANLLAPRRAMADFAIKERVYTAVTAHVASGGDALYVTDNFTGNMGVFIFTPGQGLILKGKLNLGRH
ncbi:MAG TPA: hypothetical protein VHY37_14320 [Tepidisphaeraceae bacterium]|jgi:hypothetical protein|nr:hypothetical protein [Tepidisphaeraceae bacterium]